MSHSFSTRAPDDLEERVGTLVGERYMIHRRIGRGAMGVVYEAEHVQLKKRVALKILRQEFSAHKDIVQRFEREAVAAARVDHPGVVTASDFGGLPDGSFYLVLEFVEGENLAALIRREAPLPPARAFQIAVQVNAALIAAHEAGIVHRDLKPDNVMLAQTSDPGDFVKVLDFGIAKLADEATESNPGITHAGSIFGTPEYMAPEQARGDLVDERADLYALGMLLYEMLSGTSAFRQGDLMAVLTSQMLDAPPPLPETIPSELRNLVQELLAKEPEQRPPSASALGQRLVELAKVVGFPLPLPRTNTGTLLDIGGMQREEIQRAKPDGEREKPRARRRVLRFVVPTLGLLLGAGLGVVVTIEKRPRKAPQEATPILDPKAVDEELRRRASSGEREALTELRRQTDADLADTKKLTNELERAQGNSRASRRYLALGEGFSDIRHSRASLEAYQAAVKFDPMLASNERLLCDVRSLLVDPTTAQDGLFFAQTLLGSMGADLIYDLYQTQLGQARMTSIVARAQRLVKDKNFVTVASPALAVALELERAQVCAEFREILPSAVADADQRSLPKLEALNAKTGCGSEASEDCFVCLRKADAPLEQAINTARTRPAPSYLQCPVETTPVP